MDQNHNNTVHGPVAPELGELPVSSPETAPAPAIAPPVIPGGSPSVLSVTLPLQPAAGPQPGVVKQAPVPPAPAAADDGDLIEKEWVMKAKHIVEQTRNDPHEQTKALHALKADYMKKRYNKIIGSVDE